MPLRPPRAASLAGLSFFRASIPTGFVLSPSFKPLDSHPNFLDLILDLILSDRHIYQVINDGNETHTGRKDET